jgi:hypothetical protein
VIISLLIKNKKVGKIIKKALRCLSAGKLKHKKEFPPLRAGTFPFAINLKPKFNAV